MNVYCLAMGGAKGALCFGASALLVAGCGASGTTQTAKTETATGSAPTHTVTITRPASIPSRPASGRPEKTTGPDFHFVGTGDRNLAPIHITTPSTLRWKREGKVNGEIFGFEGYPEPTTAGLGVVNETAASGESYVEPATYSQIHVIAIGPWQVTITPNR